MDDQNPSEHPPRVVFDSLISEREPCTPSKPPQLEIRKSERHFEIVGLISTVSVFCITAGTATLILGWLYAFHDPVAAGGGIMSAIQNGTFIIKEPSGPASEGSLASQTHIQTLRILTFSALASHLVSLTSTILVTLLAYRSARQWLHASENPEDTNLTPIQYGLLVRTLGSGSLMSLINTLRYTCRSKRATTPRLFKEAFVGVAGIYILSHVVGVIDLWLHSRARSISVFRGIPVQSEALYGLAYNETTCGPFSTTGLPCKNLISTRSGGTYWADGETRMYLEGFDTMSGTNPDLTLEYINDTAILVPGSNRNFKSQGFNINTHGLSVECTNLRDECDRPQSPFPVSIFPGSSPVTNCSNAGYPRFPYYTSGELEFSGYDSRNIENLVLGIIGDEMGGMLNGTADFSMGWTSNPATTVVQLRWNDPTTRFWVNHGTPGVYYLNALDLYAKCKMTYLDVIAKYDPIGAKWTIAETSLSRSELASIFWTPMIFQLWTDDLRYTLTPDILIGPEDLFDNLASWMSKYGIAYIAPLLKFTAASNVTTPQSVALGLYPVAPTLLLVGCLYIYSVTALVIFFLSCMSNNRTIFVPREFTRKKERDKESSALEVAQAWLTDPLPFIGSVFPGRDGRHITRSVEGDPLRQVYDSDWGLVKVGIGLDKGSKGEMIFRLMRQSHSRTRRYGKQFPFVHEDTTMQEEPISQPLDSEPQRCGKSDKPSSSLERPQLKIHRSRRRCRVVGLLPTLCVVAITGGGATLVLGWLYVFQDPVESRAGILSALRNGSFVIMEPSTSKEFLFSQTQTETLRILLFSALASHMVSVASTTLVTLLAYCAATQWLRASEDPDDVNLTPIQYGLLVRTLGSGGLMSIINSLRYVSRSRRGKVPGFFKEALAGVTGIYLLTHMVGLVDLWLHSSATAVSVIRSTPFELEAPYGITYSDDKCGPFNKTELPCQKLVRPHEGNMAFAPENLAVPAASYNAILDINPYLKLERVSGATILVPGPTRNYQSQTFDFNTHGLHVQCVNLEDRCEKLAAPLPQFLVPGRSPVTNCSKAGYPRIPYYTTGKLSPSGVDTRNIETLVLGLIGNEMGGMINGTADFSSAWTPNPASTVVQIRWPQVTTHDTAKSLGGAYLHTPDLYATCSLTYLDIVAHYDSLEAKWSILEASPSSAELASVFWTPLMFQWADTHLLHALKPYMTEIDEKSIEMLETALARANMGFVTSLMKFISASNVTTPRPVALGVYPAAPTLLLITCLYIYSFAAIAAFVLACASNNRTIFVPRHLTRDGERDEERSALDVAQTWLTDPLPFIGSLFPGGDGREVARSVECDPLQQVYDSSWGLEKVGVGLYKGSREEMIFGLKRQTYPRSRRYGLVFSVKDVHVERV
ncbi:hypothetical protein M407DRAFT_25971 [Tulasnella calospora MUT 4182]|uniref:Uncharacterized protein n=1 Tax=Tulasnella calospora MUT 4182 TaxID=1051891 RepID=A0A0C3LTB7_9AGAM|nr:hypothetical protein M407DRAFT_25971 [Tulasnella calospora MUT 4182]